MENENKDTQGLFLPPERIRIGLSILLTKKYGNYQEAVDALKNLAVMEDNIEEVQRVLKNVNAFLSTVESNRKDEKEPYLEQWRVIDKVHKEFAAPIEQARDEIQKKLNQVAKEKAEKVEKEQKEKERIANIHTLINNTILDFSVKIASAITNEQLLGYERLVNLEKTNKAKYAEFLPLLVERSNELTAKIKDQKELVKERDKLELEKKQAEEAGDDKKSNELMSKEAILDDKITENTVLVQEIAANSITNEVSEVYDESSPKARRTAWKAEIFDEKEVFKKAKDMLRIELNPEKVREALNTLKAAGALTGKKEIIVNGIRYFEEKTF